MNSAPVLQVDSLVKRYRTHGGAGVVTAVDDVSFVVERGEFLVLLGPSGCGKTSLLRSIAGLEKPDSGTITLGSRTVFEGRSKNLPPEERNLSMIFQTYALWPHMTAFGNIAYPLKSRGVKKSEIRSRVDSVLQLVGVFAQRDRYPHEMSGGQQQRVALARALVAETDLILFDEPLSNIDAKVREQLRFDILEMQRQIGFTAVWVTHDQNEAMQLAHRIAVIDSGRVVQIAPPADIYNNPESRMVGRFIGRTNEVRGHLNSDHSGIARVTTVHGEAKLGLLPEPLEMGAEMVVSWRPENALLSADEPGTIASDGLMIRGIITARTFVGTHTEFHFSADGHSYLAQASAASEIREGDEVRLSIPAASLSGFAADETELAS